MLNFEGITTASAVSTMLVGLGIGIRHAFDADHLAAVSTIVCDRKNLLSSLLIGGVWGIGHTASLMLAGVGVILLNISIERYEKILEFCVALMLIGLGANVLYKLVRGGRLHYHVHSHGSYTHIHPHIHENRPEPDPNSHHGLRLSIRPLIIGMVHGLAGSAALMLIVLASIKSTVLAFVYIIVFGIGSIGGMMLMSIVLSLPARYTAEHFKRTHLAVQAAAGLFSLGFGLSLAYELGFKEWLLR
jgi:ABC-type nickel/cobalt efflux system permease component RcnA